MTNRIRLLTTPSCTRAETDQVRFAFLLNYTYKDSSLNKLPGTKKSTEKVKKAVERFGFECTHLENRPHKEVREKLKQWIAEKVKEGPDAVLFYFCGHGDNHPFKSGSDDQFEESGGLVKAASTNTINFSGCTGSIGVGGDVIVDENCKVMLKSEVMKIIYEGLGTLQPSKVAHAILMFDCCRGSKNVEMAAMSVDEDSKFKLEVKQSELAELKNAHYKDSYVFHATLPHQVAWCDGGSTKFSKHLTKGLQMNPPININVMDEFINKRVEEEPESDTGGHKQMVQLDKRVIHPFNW